MYSSRNDEPVRKRGKKPYVSDNNMDDRDQTVQTTGPSNKTFERHDGEKYPNFYPEYIGEYEKAPE